MDSKIPLTSLSNQLRNVFNLAIFNIKIRFKNTYLGFLWAGLEPLLYFIVLYVVFTAIRVRVREDFAIYLITGILLYHMFTRGTTGGLGSLTSNSGILKSIKISKEVFPVTATLAIGILGIVDVAVFFALMPFFQFTPSFTIVLLPAVLAMNLMLILGVSYFLSVLNVFAKDIQHIWTVFIHALLFLTPIFWYVDDVEHGVLSYVQKINPLGQLIEIAHVLVVSHSIPPLQDWLYSLFLISIIFFGGFFFFKYFENRVSEEL